MRLKSCVALLIVLFAVSPLYTFAAEITLTPSLGFRAEYDDNIDFDRRNEVDDYVGTVSPGLSFDYGSDRFTFGASALVDVVRYLDEDDRDTENQYYSLAASYVLTERTTFSARGSYVKDTTLDSELQETGIVQERSDRDVYTAGGGLSYRISEVSDIALDYDFTRTFYELEDYTDSKEHRVSLTHSYAFNNLRDTFRVNPYYRYRDTNDDDDTDIYGLSLGISHRFTETFEVSADVGARYLEITDIAGETDSDWGWTADVSITKSWETASAEFTFSKDIGYTAEGDVVDVNRFTLTLSKMLTARLTADIAGSLYFSKDKGPVASDETVRYYDIVPSLIFALTENHSLSLAYSYSNEYDKNLSDDRERDRNRVWLALNFSFPQKW